MEVIAQSVSWRMLVCEVRPSLIEALPATVRLTPQRAPSGPHLELRVPNGDAHALLHELAGRTTMRRESLQFAVRLADTLGGHLQSVTFRPIAPGIVQSSVRLFVHGAPVDVPAEPCQCLALAAVSDLPIMYEGDLTAITRSEAESDDCSPCLWGHLGGRRSAPEIGAVR